MKTTKRKKTGGRKRAQVIYPAFSGRTAYKERDTPQGVYLSDGKPAPIVAIGSVFIYDGRQGQGGGYRISQVKKQRGGWRIFANSAYDQLARLASQYDKNYIKSRRYILDEYDKAVDYYEAQGWTNIPKTLAGLAINGVEIHIRNISAERFNELRDWLQKLASEQ